MNSDKEEIIINKILSRGTELKAPVKLSDEVLTAWKAEETFARSYPPLIPVWFWWFLGFIISGIVIWIVKSDLTSTGESIIASSVKRVLENLDFTFPHLDPVIVTAFVVMTIMLLINAFAYRLHFR